MAGGGFAVMFGDAMRVQCTAVCCIQSYVPVSSLSVFEDLRPNHWGTIGA